ncbi:hypothetical protein C0W59_07420 [Photobacterium kishitanii]|uniref:hypothetical protein n=1 Tax=Photobacterium kishitanii TaxID=318456 RepID=UPI000D152B53|nr:hypothetical protein [Photobacterium kishitanii]PSV16511.1 hypothetical protein C0W59_07420 [Photobacterium kishitanii]
MKNNCLFHIITLPLLASLSPFVFANEDPNKTDIVTSKLNGYEESNVLNKSSTINYSINNNNLVEIYPIEGQDLILPNDSMNIIVYIQNGRWARHVYLPNNANVGATVRIQRSSGWKTYARYLTKDHLIPNNSTSTFVWDGDTWVNTNIKISYLTTLQNKGMHDVALHNTQIQNITSLNITPTAITNTEKTAVSDLRNMNIDSEGIFFNNTPYTINDIYIEREGEIWRLNFETSIPEYTSGLIGIEWANAKIIHMTNIANNRFDLLNQFPPRENSRNANEEERNSVERLHMYEKYWLNAPNTMSEIIAQVALKCEINDGYSECKNYAESSMDYATDMYFAQSLSGMTSTFWIDPTVWGLATSPGKEMIKSNKSSYQTLWMSPNLMKNMLSSDQWSAVDAEQAFAHEYYHNLGFSHNSGWASYQGIDDLFGNKSYFDYRLNLGDKYVASNLVVTKEKISPLEFAFEIHSVGDINNLKVRLLSTQNITATIRQTDSDKVFLKFNEVPNTDIYVSFYSNESDQMATVVLDSFIKSVSGQGELSNLHNVFADLVDKYSKVSIHTANGSWMRDFHLPESNQDGKVIIFESWAGWNSHIFYNGTEDILTYGNRIEYHYMNGRWVRQ